MRSTLLTLLVLALCAGAAYGTFVGVRRLDRPASSAAAAATPGVITRATAAPAAIPSTTNAPAPDPSAVSHALTTALSDAALGPHVLADVVDATTGSALYARSPATAAAPASTAKLLTAVALLAVHAGTDRIATRVVAGATPGAVVLVGGGDPTLTAATGTTPGAYPDAARISDLAAQLHRAGGTITHVVVDDGLFTGPARSPAWAAEDIPSDYAAPITAAMIDGGRDAPSDTIRSVTPELAAGRALAAALGLSPAAVSLGSAPSGANVLATVQSAPMSELVEQMLQQSDNVIAECLARQVAVATHAPPSFVGAAAAIRSVLRGLGVDPGSGMVDGSGLAAGDRVPTAALAGVLHLVATAARPALRDVVTALPVAGWSGTLATRYQTAATGGIAAGVVRAKTGTLTGVSSLAGFVRDRQGRLLVFAFIADRAPATPPSETALDEAAAALAGCCG